MLVGLVATGTKSALGPAAGLSQRASVHGNTFSSDGALPCLYGGRVSGLEESAHTANTQLTQRSTTLSLVLCTVQGKHHVQWAPLCYPSITVLKGPCHAQVAKA